MFKDMGGWLANPPERIVGEVGYAFCRQEVPKSIAAIKRKSAFLKMIPKAAIAITRVPYNEGKGPDMFEAIKRTTTDIDGVLSVCAMDFGDSSVQNVAVYESMEALEAAGGKVKATFAELAEKKIFAGPPERITGEVFAAAAKKECICDIGAEKKYAAAMTTFAFKEESMEDALDFLNEIPGKIKDLPGVVSLAFILIDAVDGVQVGKACVMYETMDALKEQTPKIQETFKGMAEFLAKPPERTVGEVGYGFCKKAF
jgi:hypothetical protein